MTSVGLKRATSFQEFETGLKSILGNEEEEDMYRNMMNQLLQTPSQIQKGFEEMVKNAINDGVMCMCKIFVECNSVCRYGSGCQTDFTPEWNLQAL